MSAPLNVWDQVERRVQQRVNIHNKRHARFWKLKGSDAKPAAIRGATARLLAVDALFPYALRKRINPRRVGNITLRNVGPLLWLAWLQVWRGHVVSGEFFDEISDAIDKLVDRAVDAERHAYVSATADTGGDEKMAATTHDALGRYTEAGQAYAMEPSRDLERWENLGAEDAALKDRARIEAKENTKFREAVNKYARKKKCKKQRRAIALVVFEPGLKGFEIAAKSRVAPSTVSKIRANIDELADKILTIPDEEGTPAEVASAAAVQHDETVTQITEGSEVEGAEIDATATPGGLSLGSATMHSDMLDMAWNLRAPDVDEDVPEATMHNYAKRNSGNGFGSQWGKGRRRFTDTELVTGTRYGGRYADPAKIALHDERKQHASKFSAAELRTLEQKSAEAGFDLTGFLRAIEMFFTKRTSDGDALLAARFGRRRVPSERG